MDKVYTYVGSVDFLNMDHIEVKTDGGMDISLTGISCKNFYFGQRVKVTIDFNGTMYSFLSAEADKFNTTTIVFQHDRDSEIEISNLHKTFAKEWKLNIDTSVDVRIDPLSDSTI